MSRHLTLTLLAIGLIVAQFWRPSDAFGEPSSERLRLQDELWIVSTRSVGPGRCPLTNELQVSRYSAGAWTTAPIEELWAASDAITTVYVHGNRIDTCWAEKHGWMVYESLSHDARPEERLRFIIWSWPSERVSGPIRDARIKAERANSEGFLLGWFLAHFPVEQRLSLIGYSYGARVISGGLHVAGGGALNGLAISLPTPNRTINTTLLAAAMNSDSFSDRGTFARAQDQVGELLLFFNPADPILRRYYWLEKKDRQDALGYVGFASQPLSPLVEQFNVSNMIGKSHDIQRYFSTSKVVAMLRDNALWRSPSGSAPAYPDDEAGDDEAGDDEAGDDEAGDDDRALPVGAPGFTASWLRSHLGSDFAIARNGKCYGE
jgi:hypothetical protein